MEETNGGPWSQIRKGKVWTQPGRNGGSSSGGGGSGIPAAPGGGSGGGSRTRVIPLYSRTAPSIISSI